MLKLFNTLGRKIEEFVPINPDQVTMYACGPTVYNYQHIGNYRKYINDDTLKKVLRANGFTIKHVMNITDVGHLISDEDQGEDKMEKGARESGQTVWEVAKFYEQDFLKWFIPFNIQIPDVVARATEHVGEMTKLIHKLKEKSFTYQTDQAIYFDTSKFSTYTQFSGQKLAEKEVGVRDKVVVDSDKKHPSDFALWFFTVGHFENHTMKWDSPWGQGFPGWHIECSAMSMLYLGDTLDIHTGGVEHIPVHHTNEIAQSEGATGKKFVNFWIHSNHLQIEDEKMSKSQGNVYLPKDLIEKGFDLLALRYLFLTTSYRDYLNMSWKSLEAAQNALNNLRSEVRTWDQPSEFVIPAKAGIQDNGSRVKPGMTGQQSYWQKFLEAVNNDLNTSQGLAVMWDLVKSDLETGAKSATILEMDKVLGLGLDQYVGKPREIPKEVSKLVDQREQARIKKDFKESDKLRGEIKKLGFEVLDTPEGPRVR